MRYHQCQCRWDCSCQKDNEVQLSRRDPRFLSSGHGNTWPHECQCPGIPDSTNRNSLDGCDDWSARNNFLNISALGNWVPWALKNKWQNAYQDAVQLVLWLTGHRQIEIVEFRLESIQIRVCNCAVIEGRPINSLSNGSCTWSVIANHASFAMM